MLRNLSKGADPDRADEVVGGLLSQSNAILSHITLQEDTVICLLDKIARSTCAILNEESKQTLAQMEMRDHMADLAFMYATDHPASALELARTKTTAGRIDKCCPPETPDPACRFEPCDRPDQFTIRQVDSKVPPYPFEPRTPQGPH